MELKTVTDRVSYVRKQLGLDQPSFAKSIGITKAAVNQWEQGTAKPGPTSLFKIEKAHGYSAKWLATGEGPMRLEESVSPRAQRVAELFDGLDPKSQDNIFEIIDALATKREDKGQVDKEDPPARSA